MDSNNSLFIHYSQMVTWRDAQAFCRRYHSDLVTVTSDRENQKLYVTRGWIGLYRADSGSPWKWSRRDETAPFTTWASGCERQTDTGSQRLPVFSLLILCLLSASDPTANQNCAYKTPNVPTWQTDGCDLTHTFNCFDETLVLVTKNKTWEEALSHCRALEAVDPGRPASDPGNNRYDLATLLTPDDYSSAQDKVQDATSDTVGGPPGAWRSAPRPLCSRPIRVLGVDRAALPGRSVAVGGRRTDAEHGQSLLCSSGVLWRPGPEQQHALLD